MPDGRRQSTAAALCCALLAACGAGGSSPSERDPASEMPAEEAARPALCERAGDDLIRDVFCAPQAAAIADLEDLQQRLGVPLVMADQVEPGGAQIIAIFLGHSTALSGHLVSPINPRVFLPGAEVVMAFQRGVQRVELAVRARDAQAVRFYLVTFGQACNQSRRGCSPGDLYTPRIERDWQSVAVEDDEDLKNTPLDCRQCHQRGGDTPMLLMRELRSPWTHFFLNPRLAQLLGQTQQADLRTLSGVALDYQLAKGDEPYANLPAESLHDTQPGVLQLTVGPQQQPLIFDSMTIASERGVVGPERNPDASSARSPTWDRAYAAFKRGESLPLPYFAERATDPDKQAALGAAYQRYLRDEIGADELPDLADVFPDDPQTRAEIGLQNEPLATPAETLIQACGSCHNDVLDQTISRARFSIALDRMDREQLDLAINRLQRAADDPDAMPPREARQLDPEARSALIAYLEQREPPAEDRALLQSAATLGMAGMTPQK